MAKQTRVSTLADLFHVPGPHTRAKTLFSIKLQETADRLIDGGAFAALHQPGMFDYPRQRCLRGSCLPTEEAIRKPHSVPYM
jgi:hypothetical protein